jgi:hypothetical protein
VKPTVAVLYGDAGSAALIAALKSWRKEHAPNLSYEAILAEGVTSCKVQQTIYPGGRSTIHVRIEAKRRGHDDEYWFEAALAAGQLKLHSIT